MNKEQKDSASVGAGMAAAGAVIIVSALFGVPIVTYKAVRYLFWGSSSSE